MFRVLIGYKRWVLVDLVLFGEQVEEQELVHVDLTRMGGEIPAEEEEPEETQRKFGFGRQR